MVVAPPDAALAQAVLREIGDLVRSGQDAGNDSKAVGIVSSAAAQDPHRVTGLAAVWNSDGNGTMLVGPSWRGFAVDADSILVSYGYVGDLDLDGTVDADDFARMDRGHLAARAGAPTRGYRDGDLDYDGDVDISDYFHIDRTHATQAAPLGVVPAAVALATSPRPALRPSLVEADPLDVLGE